MKKTKRPTTEERLFIAEQQLFEAQQKLHEAEQKVIEVEQKLLEKKNLLLAATNLKKTYDKVFPENCETVGNIKLALSNKWITFEDIDLSQEIFEIIIDEMKQLALDLCNAYIVDGKNFLTNFLSPYQEERDKPLKEHEKRFVLEAFMSDIIIPQEAKDSCKEYAESRNGKKAFNKFTRSLTKKLPEETEIEQNGFSGFYPQ